MKSRSYTIYALIDPRDNTVRYVGLTEYPDVRLKQHILGDGNVPKRKWVSELNRLGLSPVMQAIETTRTLADALDREAYWIKYYLDAGANLVNIRLTPYVNHRIASYESLWQETGTARITLDGLIRESGIKKASLSAQSGVSVASIIRICQGAPTSKITVIKLLKVLRKSLNRHIEIEDIDGLNITR